MKREGYQHGMIRTINKNGCMEYAKAPSKPTNHSKFSGKCKKVRCPRCHAHPVSKSRDKGKGSYKSKSSDVVLNTNVDHWSKLVGSSASGVLDALLHDSFHSQGSDDNCYYSNGYDQEVEVEGCFDVCDGNAEEIKEEAGEDDMGFHEVGFVLEYMEDEGWYVVNEM